ncbi:MAG: competence/damage-inducible protein A [Tepidisphaerales bacterium]
MLSAVIISVGDELTLGQTVDTNSAWLSRQLAAMGIDVAGHVTVPDSRPAIAAAIRQACEAAEVVVVTGGLGPTEDDLTREALADAMGVELVRDESLLAEIRGFFERLGRAMPPRNEVQAYLPRGARAIPNSRGTAPGIAATVGRSRVVVMPGVPKEMYAMWETHVAPELSKLSGGAVVLSRTLHTFGLGESSVAERLGELMARDRNPSVGTTVSHGIVSLRLNVRAETRDEGQRRLDEVEAACRQKLGLLIFGRDEQTLPQVVGELLRAARLTVATAESCTGGLIAKYLTDVPGSSAYMHAGWVCYANAAKVELLGVDAGLIDRHGAVSEVVASAMARGAMRAGTDLAVSVTGIAGPDGGTPTKPVGTVCIGLAWRGPTGDVVTRERSFLFPGDRETIRDRAAKTALSLLRFHVLRQPVPF